MKILTRLLACVLAVSMMAGCTDSGNSSSSGGDVADGGKKIITVGIGEEGKGFDPAIAEDSVSNNILNHMFEGMFVLNGSTLENAMCESYEISDDQLTYTFKIRDNAVWSDDSAVTAADFVNGIRRSLNPEMQGLYANFIYEYVAGALDVYEGRAEFDSVGVKAIDEKTLEIKLIEPCPYFLQLMTNGVYFPVKESVANGADSKWAKDPAVCLANGAFKLVEYVPNSKVVFEKNDNYFRADEVKLDGLEYRFMPDMQAQVAAYKTGEINVAQNVPSDIAAQYADQPDYMYIQSVINYYVVLRDGTEAVSNPDVRKAMAMAINRSELAEILGGGERPLYGLVPYGLQNPSTGKDFREEGGDLFKEDVVAAQKLLADAGYPNGEGFPTLSYIYNENQRHSDTAQAIQAMWEQNLGIKIELKSQEFKVLLDDRNAGNFQLARHAMSADYADPYAYLGMYIGGGVQNESKFVSERYDELMAQSSVEADPAKRFELMHEAEKVLIEEEMRMIPLYTYGSPILVNEGITGIESNPAAHISFKFVDVA